MYLLKKAAALASMVGAMALAGAAQATVTVYSLNTTDNAGFGAGPYGSVTVDTAPVGGQPGELDLTVDLFNGVTTTTGSHHALTFNLSGSNVTATFSPKNVGDGFTFLSFPGSYSNPGAPFTFNAAVDCTTCTGGSATAGVPWTIKLFGTGLSLLNTNFAADQLQTVNCTGACTGVVWTGGGGGGVPEPAEWSLLILGFGATGFVLRRRRNKDPLMAAA
jgi:hypothetical protein